MNILIRVFEKTLNKFIERNNGKKLVYIMCSMILVMMIFPVLYLSFFNFMCADDFVYAQATHNIWIENKNFIGVLKVLVAAFTEAKKTYLTWGGNYTSAFFSALQPSIFYYRLTFINTFLFVGLFMFSNFVFLKKVCRFYFKLQSYVIYLLFTIIMFLSIQFLPSAVEAFYWFNGSFYNIMGWSFSLLLLTVLIRIIEKNRISVRDMILGIVISIFIGGTAYSIITALFLVLFLLGMDVFSNKNLNIKVKLSIGFIILIFLIASMVSIVAPGNLVRQTPLNQEGILKSIIVSIFNGGSLIISYFDLKIILFSIFLTPFLWTNIKIDKKKYKFPIIILITSFLVLSSAITPTIRAMGTIGVGRTQNIYWWLFIMLYFLNFIYCLGWLKNTLVDSIFQRITLDKQKIICFEIIIVIFLLFTVKIQDKEATSYEAYREILVGEMTTYKAQMEERESLYNDKDIDIIYVDQLIYKPALLFFDDISEDETDWRNLAIIKYYNKKSIALKSKDETK